MSFLKLFIAVCLLAFASPAFALQTNYPVITDIDVADCGEDATVTVSGTATFKNDQECVRIYKQYEGQGFYQWVATDCSSPENWSFNLYLDPNFWSVRVRVDTPEGFNKVHTDSPYFTVNECTCP